MGLLILWGDEDLPLPDSAPIRTRVRSDDFSQPTEPLFHSAREKEVYNRMLVEGYRMVYPSIPVILIDRDKTKVDPILREARTRVWQKPRYIPGHVQWSPPVYVLARFGIESEQEVLITFPDAAVKASGIEELQDMVGGVLVMDLDKEKDRKEYEILSVHKQPQDAWSMTGDVMNVAVTVDIRIPSSTTEKSDLPDFFDSFNRLF